MTDISIVVPVFYNEESISPLYERIKNSMPKGKHFEVIFVDDGSGDNSYSELIKIKKSFPDNVKIIKLTKNFGQVAAIMAGYSISKGDCIINISADLQDPPELIPRMVEIFTSNSNQIVICTREERDESFYRRFTSKLFYNFTRNLAFKNMPDGGFDYALIGKKVKQEILNYPDANPFWQGLILNTGYQPQFIRYKREKRQFGKSRWTFNKKVKYLIDAIFNYSFFPIRLMTYLGIVISMFSFIYAFIIIILKVFNEIPIKGWAPIMIVILFLSGIQLIMLGVIGEYVWRTMEQVKKKSLYVIEKIN